MNIRLITLFSAAAIALHTTAQNPRTAREELAENPCLGGSNYLDYDRQLADAPLTPAPKGYIPYYISHYGRHGSRWLIGEGDYNNPLQTLRLAHRYGKLTPIGETTLEQLERFMPTTVKRRGDLTTVGERQHHGIGRRMTEHFPEIFRAKGLLVDARSTNVVRCILSMEAECEELMAANPTARIHNDVSESLQYYLNASYPDTLNRARRKGHDAKEAFTLSHTHPQRLMQQLFNDEAWVYDNVQAGVLMRQLFQVAQNMQSHDTDIDLMPLFTPDEVYDLWRVSNVSWYIDYGPARESCGVMPMSQVPLLRNIIETADTVQLTQATLRFGHEVCVLPLACLLELGQFGQPADNLEQLDATWRNYRAFPMAGNIQLVFYRPRKGDGPILVKALLNEREMTLPVATQQHPYYPWAELRQYYLEKLKNWK